MSPLPSIISRSLSKQQFLSFSEFEQAVLSKDKTESLRATLEIGLRVSTIGQAFSLGYRCALQNLMPDFNQNEWAAFCVTEEAGAHPKKLKTTVSEDGILSGSKSFVSMADKAKQLLVIAVAGQNIDRPILKAVKISLPLVGIDLTIMPNMGMMPEVVHGKIALNRVKGEVLEGDGYLDFNKKFRIIEDAHLLMAFTSLVLSKVIRCKLDDSLIDDCLVVITSLLTLKFSDDPFSVLQLAGLYRSFELLRSKFELELNNMGGDFKVEWCRDSKIFGLARKSREQQRMRAVDYFIV